eukprot:CAMPEP_0172439910 /NCGR_PEP_ID=MMETSP1065-20121228/746_1 /TAXON_ID=265537 /ORGANISM="Amphiprora paludosa, Strain CCMP125" /LENGTH=287 /DNA_ID=CAMNT_0013188669 /DNA_START=43 /DNA_END=906 /DNA_ORIENTATION=-
MSSSSEAEFEEGEEIEEGEEAEEPEEEPAPRRAKRQISYKEDDDLDGAGDYVEEEEEDDDDDSDDDIPLSELAGQKKKPAAAAAKKNGAKKAPAKKKAKTNGTAAADKKKKAAAAAKKAAPSSGGSSKSYDYASEAFYGTECDKGLLVQRLLCRWWYAYEWPANVQTEPPENYDPLDGFPGVFVGTAGDQVGKILDTRNAETRPCFQNFANKPSAELKELVLQAIDGQTRVLEEQVQHGTASADVETVLKDLKSMRKWANRVNADKADKEANKVLKAAKLKLKMEGA